MRGETRISPSWACRHPFRPLRLTGRGPAGSARGRIREVGLTRSETAGEGTLAGILAERLRQQREALVHRWLQRIAARVNIDPNEVFPTEALLDHVPLLVDGIAE